MPVIPNAAVAMPHTTASLNNPAREARIQPLAADDDQHDAAGRQTGVDRVDEILAGSQRVHIAEDLIGPEPAFEGLAKTSGVPGGIVATITDEGARHPRRDYSWPLTTVRPGHGVKLMRLT